MANEPQAPEALMVSDSGRVWGKKQEKRKTELYRDADHLGRRVDLHAVGKQFAHRQQMPAGVLDEEEKRKKEKKKREGGKENSLLTRPFAS
jgi:hypothetical protein